MEKLTRTEITWIIELLKNKASELNNFASDCKQSGLTELCKLRAENLTTSADKLQAAFDTNDKHIAID